LWRISSGFIYCLNKGGGMADVIAEISKVVGSGTLTEYQRRFLRARWLLANMGKERVDEAVAAGMLEPDARAFIEETAELVRKIEDGRAEPGDLQQIVLDRLEDTYMWSQPRAKLTVAEKRQVAEWCRRDGHSNLADEVERGIREDSG